MLRRTCAWLIVFALAACQGGPLPPPVVATPGAPTQGVLPPAAALTATEALIPPSMATPAPPQLASAIPHVSVLPATELPAPTSVGGQTGTLVSRRGDTGLPAFSHVFIIVMENHEASQIVGNSGAPYINSLAASYGRAANYYAVTHPSLPNYLALTGGDTFGITDDCVTCSVSADNIATQLETAGRTWKAYMESLPQPCSDAATAGEYAKRHDPFMYYDDIRSAPGRCGNVVPLTQLATDLQTAALPDLAWITPNVCSDMHDCPVSAGDAWLRAWVPRILASAAWKNAGVLFIVFDEGTSSAGCCQYAAGGQVDALVVSPLARSGYVSHVAYDHYSLLRTIEQAWGLPLLARAGSSATAPMIDFFTPP